MKLQATKVFTKWLNNNISHFDGVERFDLLKLTEEQYTRYVDYRGVYESYEYGDYDDSDVWEYHLLRLIRRMLIIILRSIGGKIKCQRN